MIIKERWSSITPSNSCHLCQAQICPDHYWWWKISTFTVDMNGKFSVLANSLNQIYLGENNITWQAIPSFLWSIWAPLHHMEWSFCSESDFVPPTLESKNMFWCRLMSLTLRWSLMSLGSLFSRSGPPNLPRGPPCSPAPHPSPTPIDGWCLGLESLGPLSCLHCPAGGCCLVSYGQCP